MSKSKLQVARTKPTPALRRLARRVIWFEPPGKALADPVRFLCYLMAYPTPEDLAVAGKAFSRDDFQTALRNAPPGVFSLRAWRYWNFVLEGHTKRPLPQRYANTAPVPPAG